MIRTFVLGAVVACLTGCIDTKRTSIPREESHYERIVTHTLARGAAFRRVEAGLHESYPNVGKVLRSKQPEKGSFLLEPTVTYRTGGPMGTVHHAPYTLAIVVHDKAVEMTFDLRKDPATDDWAPESAIPYIHHDFDVVVTNVEEALAGH